METNEQKEIINKEFMGCIKAILDINENKEIPNYKVNEKIKKKFLEGMPFTNYPDNLEKEDEKEVNNDDDRKTQIEYGAYPSGIKVKIIKYIDNDKIKKKEFDYSELDEKYLNQIKENPDEQLQLLIENIGLIYNFHSSIIKKIVKKPFSYKVLVDKMLLWQHYMEILDNVGKAQILEKWLNQLLIFSEKCYKEFMKIKQIKKAYLIFEEKKRINEDMPIVMKYDEYYAFDEIFGIDIKGNIIKEIKDVILDSNKLFLIKKNVLDIKSELEGNGVSFIFLEELKNLAEMFWYSSIIYLRLFYDGLVLFKDCFFQKYIRIQSIMISFFSDTFLEKHFVISLLCYLKYLFGSYKEYEILKYMQRICMARVQDYNAQNDLRNAINKMINEKNNYQNIDDLVKYIEGDKKEKKKKKRKKKNYPINLLDSLIGTKNKIENEDDEHLDDGISIISEADSVVKAFKNEIINDTISNNGEKLKPIFSKNFLNYLEN